MAYANGGRWAGPQAEEDGDHPPPCTLPGWQGQAGPLPATDTPRPHFPPRSGTHQKSSAPDTVRKLSGLGTGPCGSKKGTRGQSRTVFIGGVKSRNNNKPTGSPPQVPSSPPSPAGQAASRVRATRQRQGLHFASAKARQSPRHPRSPLLGDRKLSLALPEAGLSPSPPSRGELCVRVVFVKGRTGAQLHRSARGRDLCCSSQWDILGERKPCCLGRAAAATGKTWHR